MRRADDMPVRYQSQEVEIASLKVLDMRISNGEREQADVAAADPDLSNACATMRRHVLQGLTWRREHSVLAKPLNYNGAAP
jgi:hypothetical protein